MAHSLLLTPVAMTVVGCFPPSLELEPAEEVNAPPVLLSVRGPTGEELPWPGPVTLVRGTGTATLLVRDNNLDDSIYAQFFVDYGRPDPQPTRTPNCRIGPVTNTASPDRTLRCDIQGVCLPSDIGVSRTLLIDVYDRQPQVGSGSELFRTVLEPGYRYEKEYELLCVDAFAAARELSLDAIGDLDAGDAWEAAP